MKIIKFNISKSSIDVIMSLLQLYFHLIKYDTCVYVLEPTFGKCLDFLWGFRYFVSITTDFLINRSFKTHFEDSVDGK